MRAKAMDPKTDDERHRLIGIWLAYEGELRAALARVVLVACCYAAQLLNYTVFAERTEVAVQFHRQATYVAAGWLFVSLAVLVALTRRWLPVWLKYLTQSIDVVLLTLLASLGSGPQSPLVTMYFVLIAFAALRCDLVLLWYGTLSAMAGYLFLVALNDPKWFDPDHTTPLIEQMVTYLALGATGVIAGQLVRMMLQVTEGQSMRQAYNANSGERN